MIGIFLFCINMKVSDLKEGDFHPFYGPYIDTLGDPDLLEMLKRQKGNFPEFIASIPDELWHSAYEEGKWTIAEVLVHILDAERVFQYRALRIGRGDTTPLPGFDQDAYVPASGAAQRSKEEIIEEYRIVRASTISLYSQFSEEDLRLKGVASNSPTSVGALGFIICGHQKHHRNIIRSRYLNN